ncbi:MAG: SusC/RagA family TonB-linked outer membrane protein [Capnocytophaga felis]|nr:SusC/RagA family TonB-linked outer membrane protein [Capnocytophaga felis]
MKNSNRGISTDFDGNFEIRAEQGDILVFSSLGFSTQEKVVGKDKSKTMKIILMEEAQAIEEVVVVGYGSGRKVGTVVGSVAKVGGTELSQRPSGNAVDALQGKVAGLQIFTSSGEPSALSSIRLHGVGSLGSGSTPLFVVDGVPVSQEAVRSLNQADFESVSILKDASATSIYGSRAANGVVYITTKRGKTGKGEIMLNTQYGFSNLANRDFFENMMNADELSQFWLETGYRTQKQIDELREKYPADTRWDEVYFQKNTPTQQADLSISGGTDKTRYYVSGGYFKQKGIMYRSGFERYTFRSNIDTRVNDWMKLDINASINYYDFITNAYTSNSTNGGISFLAPPFYSPTDEKGQRYDYIPGWNRYHPEYLAEKLPSNYTGLGVIPTGFIEITPIKNLTFKTQGGLEFTNGVYSFTQLPSYARDPKNGMARRQASRNLRKTLTNTLEYKFDVAKNHFMVLVGQEVVSEDARSFQAEGTKLINDDLILLRHTTSNKEIKEDRSFNITKSIFGRMEYDYDRKYYFDFSLRRDGSSKFSPNNKYGTFWAVGAMWKMKKENFLSDVSAINDLDLKFSAGTSGNSAIGDYTYQALTSANQYGEKTSWAISAAGNPNLTWENQAKYTLSVDSRLFNRASLSVELYNRITTDMLMDIPTAYTTGFSSIKQNVGKLQNLGVGVSLSADVYKELILTFYFTQFSLFQSTLPKSKKP